MVSPDILANRAEINVINVIVSGIIQPINRHIVASLSFLNDIAGPLAYPLEILKADRPF